MSRLLLAPLSIAIALAASPGPTTHQISHGTLFVEGREIPLPFTLGSGKNGLLINGAPIPSRDSAAARPPPLPSPRQRRVARLMNDLYGDLRRMHDRGASRSAMHQFAIRRLTDSGLIDVVSSGDETHIGYQVKGEKFPVLMDLTIRPHPPRGSTAVVDSQVASMRQVLEQGGMVLIGAGCVTYIPAIRVPEVRREIENLRRGVAIPVGSGLLPKPVARAFMPPAAAAKGKQP